MSSWSKSKKTTSRGVLSGMLVFQTESHKAFLLLLAIDNLKVRDRKCPGSTWQS